MDDMTIARVACPACKLLGPPISPASAAQQLATVHDDFQHRGHATALVRAGVAFAGADLPEAAAA